MKNTLEEKQVTLCVGTHCDRGVQVARRAPSNGTFPIWLWRPSYHAHSPITTLNPLSRSWFGGRPDCGLTSSDGTPNASTLPRPEKQAPKAYNLW